MTAYNFLVSIGLIGYGYGMRRWHDSLMKDGLNKIVSFIITLFWPFLITLLGLIWIGIIVFYYIEDWKWRRSAEYKRYMLILQNDPKFQEWLNK